MINVSLKDSAFSHATSYSHGDLKIYSKYISWDRENIHDVIFYTDSHIASEMPYSYKTHKNIAWILEPISISSVLYSTSYTDWSKFDFVISHNLKFINELKLNCKTNPLWCAVGGCWIEEIDRLIHTKTKNLSVISSGKTMTYGHNLRHRIINLYKNNITDIFGGGYNPIKYKLDALKEYRFSVIIENDNSDDWFTEKLIDCLITGTIPIYWGTKNINKYFNVEGFLVIENEFDFKNIIPALTEEYYMSKLDIIQSNFELAKKYVNTEDWIYLNLGNIIFNN